MRILQISTYDVSGGAALAAYRLHCGLRQLDYDCRMLVRTKDSPDPYVLAVSQKAQDRASEAESLYLSEAIQGHYIDAHRTALSNTLFSLPYPGLDLSKLPLVREADIINLHWVAQFQSPPTLRRLFDLGKPVVWTLHDQWAFTGGCHYAAGCEGYRADCRPCPQLADDPDHLPEAALKDKLVLFRDAPLTLVTPSRWMGDSAHQSALFNGVRVEVIPNALETDRFKPLPKTEAKKRLGLRPDSVTLLFGGVTANEKRKGFNKLAEAVKVCLKDGEFNTLLNRKKVAVICFGHASDAAEAVGIPVKALGYLKSVDEIVNAYCAADLFILPSLEDNLPNTMLEAMSCGTPVVAFDVGGIPEGVKNGKTGRLVPSGDGAEMGRSILHLIFHSEQRVAMSEACRLHAEEHYRLEIQARRYATLYQELIDSCKPTGRLAKGKRGSRAWSKPSLSRKKPFVAPLESNLGPHFKRIYDSVLFKSLKEFSSHVNGQLQASETDRAERLHVIHEVAAKLEASEADRAARGELIQEVSDRLSRSEADRLALVEQIETVSDQLATSETDRAAKAVLIDALSIGNECLETELLELRKNMKIIEEILGGSLIDLLKYRRIQKKEMKTKTIATTPRRGS